MIMSCDNNQQRKRAYRAFALCAFGSWYVSRGTRATSLGSLEPIQKAITEFRRGRARAKLTKGHGGPRLSRAGRPISNVAGAANCVTAIRTGRNEIRRIARIVRLRVSGARAPYDLFHPGGTIAPPQGIVETSGREAHAATPRIAISGGHPRILRTQLLRMVRRNIRNNAPAYVRANWF